MVDPKILAAAAAAASSKNKQQQRRNIWPAVAASAKKNRPTVAPEQRIGTFASQTEKGPCSTENRGSAPTSLRRKSQGFDLRIEETRKIQELAGEHVKRVLDEHGKLNSDLDNQKLFLDSCSVELIKCEMLIKRKRQRIEKEKKKNDERKSALHMAAREQKRADENVLMLVDDLKWEKKEAEKIIKELNEKIKEKEEAEKKMKELNEKLQEEIKEKEGVMNLLLAKDRRSIFDELQSAHHELMDIVDPVNDRDNELQRVRNKLIEGLGGIFVGSTDIGMRSSGRFRENPFRKECYKRFSMEEASKKSSDLYVMWNQKINLSAWHPFKIVRINSSNVEDVISRFTQPTFFLFSALCSLPMCSMMQKVLDENDEDLLKLKEEWGEGVYNSIAEVLKEKVKYTGRYELWNFKEDRKATLKEVISSIFKPLEALKDNRKV